MAAVVKAKPRAVQIPGYEFNDVCELLEDVDVGDLLEFTGVMSRGQAVMRKLPAGAANEPDGISLRKNFAGARGHDVGIQGEMDGFSGLNPGDLIWPSGAVAGGMDTTPPVVAAADPIPTIPSARIKAVRATRIRYTFR